MGTSVAIEDGPVDRAEGLADDLRDVLSLGEDDVPDALARSALDAALAGGGWDADAAVAVLVARMGDDAAPAALRSCVDAARHAMAATPHPPRRHTLTILGTPKARRKALNHWVDDMPVICGHPGFARILGTVVESAAQDPDTFVETNVARLEATRGDAFDRRSDARAEPRIATLLRMLASRPLHPAWPALVFWAVGEHFVEGMRPTMERIGDDRANVEDDETLHVSGCYLGRHKPAIAAAMPGDLLDALMGLPNARLASMADGVVTGIGTCLREMGPTFATLTAMPDMPEACPGLDGATGLLDRDCLPWGYLGDPDRQAWKRLVDRRDGVTEHHGLWSRTVATPGDAAACLPGLAGWEDVARGIYPDGMEAEIVVAVGVGPRPYAVLPIAALRLSCSVSVVPGLSTVRYEARAVALGEGVEPDGAAMALDVALATVFAHDATARKVAVERGTVCTTAVEVEVDVSAVASALPGFGDLAASSAGRAAIVRGGKAPLVAP